MYISVHIVIMIVIDVDHVVSFLTREQTPSDRDAHPCSSWGVVHGVNIDNDNDDNDNDDNDNDNNRPAMAYGAWCALTY